MSVHHINWAFKQEIDKPGAKLVLVALANFADQKSGTCFPGQNYLARQTSLGERTARRHLNGLERAGYIRRRKRRRKDGSRTSDLITLNTDLDVQTIHSAEAELPANSDLPTGQAAQTSPAKSAGLYTEVDPALYTSASKEDSILVEPGNQEGSQSDLVGRDEHVEERDRMATEYYRLPADDRALIQKFGLDDLWEQAVDIEVKHPGAGTDWLVEAVRDIAESSDAIHSPDGNDDFPLCPKREEPCR